METNQNAAKAEPQSTQAEQGTELEHGKENTSISAQKASHVSSMSFDDFLKQEGNQAEFDRRINAAVQKGVSNAQKKWETITNDRVSEAEKLAMMTAAEKTDYLQKKKAKELDEKEAQINRRELEASAKNTLAEKGLPLELAAILPYQDAEGTKAAIDKVEEAFRKSVQNAVSQRLKGGQPMKKAGEPTKEDMEREVAEAISRHI